jgi:hypothetical protein
MELIENHFATGSGETLDFITREHVGWSVGRLHSCLEHSPFQWM